ncbi:flagellar M-ring protein FliF [Corallococcus praedator]|uniref:Flagellar M-ring protein FliF n=1 Tax=Corallococcus praedator TaxID=2316724 RepID=A0ABX9QLD4_9BACT|nr:MULTISPECIES: flagellar M-ring protein FliF [Corallococcus]RKH17568.1 flagellar M-ring protein FliF [Corallococcus sp. CA047B]RKH34257.1 flagellar M-ring protein FliF [Corallococcus sp. CA031C]RKI12382.1 flagellar M-ring protein FliF [Corallococcus praedator]
MRSAPFRCLFFLLLLGASACRERIQHGLDERQANELQTVLVERGLDARKVPEPGKKPTWAIEVTDAQASDAVRILAELGLPRLAVESGCDVFGGSGLVRSPLEEQVCRVRVMERELEKTLQTVDGVLLARVHLVVPTPPRPGQPPTPSKASAMLRAVPGGASRVRKSADTLRELIAGGVEGLAPESVSLLVDEVTTRVEVPAPRGGPVPLRLRVLLALLGVLVTGLSGALVWTTLRWRHFRTLAEKPPAAPPAPPTPARPVVTPGSARKLA